ncbi:MAG TPA: AIPR family protein [Pirellulales bacterium]|nr:AIPR family protein [Pirellulales bacterium]
MSASTTSAPTLKSYRFRTARAFKALDDGIRRKWVFVVAARDIPRDLPLDANARVPNVIKNPHCKEMRETLLTRPELFQVFNGGMVCTATIVDVKQEGTEQWAEVAFDLNQLQGVVNGGHTYGALLHVIHDHPIYAEGMDLKTVLLKKDKLPDDNPVLAALVQDDEKLAERIAKARERTMVQLELVAPVSDPELLHDIALFRNLSLSVDQTALQNLAGKYETMKSVLAEAPPPIGPTFVERVVWKTNQEVPEDSVEVPVKTLVHLLALMNTRLYPPGAKVANSVYVRSGVIVREFGEVEGDDSAFYDKLTTMLPEFIKLYDHIYLTLPTTNESFPWADGKPPSDGKRRKKAFTTPLLAKTCTSKVSGAFIWPVFSAFRQLLEEDGNGGLRFKTNPIDLFNDKKAELSSTIQTVFENQGRMVQQVGKTTDAWIRLEAQIQMEMMIRERTGQG